MKWKALDDTKLTVMFLNDEEIKKNDIVWIETNIIQGRYCGPGRVVRTIGICHFIVGLPISFFGLNSVLVFETNIKARL